MSKLSFRAPPQDVIDAAKKVAEYMLVHDLVQIMGLERVSSQPLAKEQANRLRGLVARHAHCQKEAGRLTPETPWDDFQRVRKDAARAQQAVYSYLNGLKRK